MKKCRKILLKIMIRMNKQAYRKEVFKKYRKKLQQNLKVRLLKSRNKLKIQENILKIEVSKEITRGDQGIENIEEKEVVHMIDQEVEKNHIRKKINIEEKGLMIDIKQRVKKEGIVTLTLDPDQVVYIVAVVHL